MDRQSHSQAFSYAELEEKARIRRARYETEDRIFEADCAKEIELLEFGNAAKLEKIDEETRLKTEDLAKAAVNSISTLKAKHEIELQALRQRHAKELAKLEIDGKLEHQKAVDKARDDRSDLERALTDAVVNKKKEHSQREEQRSLKRKPEIDAERELLYDVFQRTISGHASESSRNPPSEEPHSDPVHLLSSPSQLEHSPPYSPPGVPESQELTLPTRISKRKKLTIDDDSSMTMAMQIDEEPPVVPPALDPKSSPWGFGDRYFKAKHKLATLPAVLKSDPVLSKQNAQAKSKAVTSSDQGRRRDSQHVVHRSTQGTSNVSPILSRQLANISSPFSKAPSNAPKGPRGTPINSTGQQGMPDESISDTGGSKKSRKRARPESRGYSIQECSPRRGTDSLYNLTQSDSRRQDRQAISAAPSGDRETSRPALLQYQERRESDSWRPSGHHPSHNYPDSNRFNESLVSASRYHADSLGSRHRNDERAGPANGTLPICPPPAVSSALERVSNDPSSDPPLPRKPNPVNKTHFAIKQIRYPRNDETVFEWTQSSPGKTELRLDNFIYKPFIKNQVWEVCQDWHYSNWAIVPDHVEILKFNQEFAVLHLQRMKTAQASTELWIRFENGEILTEFLTSFKGRPGCAGKDIIPLGMIGIPELFTKD